MGSLLPWRGALDVRSTQAVAALARAVSEQFGALDILVN